MELIGRGSYGKVYVCEEDKNTVVKIIKNENTSIVENPFGLKSLTSGHENIAKILDVKLEFDMMYIFMKRYECDLAESLSRSKALLPLNLTLKLEKQIGSSIEYLHNRNILHADVKPENILLNRDMDFFLCDFSLSMDIKKERLYMNNQIYTPLYRPPILFYNCHLKKGDQLYPCFDYFALFMTLCFAYLGLTIIPMDAKFTNFEIIECFWFFKKYKFNRLLNHPFEALNLKDKYREAFRLCF